MENESRCQRYLLLHARHKLLIYIRKITKHMNGVKYNITTFLKSLHKVLFEHNYSNVKELAPKSSRLRL